MKKNKNLLHLGNPLLIAAAANTAGEVISKQADLRKEKIVADKEIKLYKLQHNIADSYTGLKIVAGIAGIALVGYAAYRIYSRWLEKKKLNGKEGEQAIKLRASVTGVKLPDALPWYIPIPSDLIPQLPNVVTRQGANKAALIQLSTEITDFGQVSKLYTDFYKSDLKKDLELSLSSDDVILFMNNIDKNKGKSEKDLTKEAIDAKYAGYWASFPNGATLYQKTGLLGKTLTAPANSSIMSGRVIHIVSTLTNKFVAIKGMDKDAVWRNAYVKFNQVKFITPPTFTTKTYVEGTTPVYIPTNFDSLE